VKDYVAHDVARTFYREMHDHPDQPLAAIFKTIRRRAYERVGGEDTYAAYAFYRDRQRGPGRRPRLTAGFGRLPVARFVRPPWRLGAAPTLASRCTLRS
jgi:hypothetical protein